MMDSVNKTLYIPLYGKAQVSRKGLILHDPKAEEIWEKEGFALKGKAASRWLAYYMGMRSAVFDRWLREKLEGNPDAAVLHLGCGMDSRILRVGNQGKAWFDVDFPEVIWERQRYFAEGEGYRMIAADLREKDWLEALPRGGTALVVMEGVSMYLRPEELAAVLGSVAERFDRVFLLMDCYSVFAARATRYKNPINTVGVTQVYGMDDPRLPGTGLSYVGEKEMTPEELVCQLSGMERRIFQKVFAGKMAKKIYRLYEYETQAAQR